MSAPRISVRTINGTGAELATEVTQFNTYSKVTAKVKKKGLGNKEGYWSTTRSFLNSDKYIQDSNFYQDYSYQIKAGLTLDKYKDILYNTFHVAGSKLFGLFFLQIQEESQNAILYNSTQPIYLSAYSPEWDSTLINTSDAITTMDQIP